MKSNRSESSCEPIIKYPCLMVGKRTGNVYLMVTEYKGTVVSVGKDCGKDMRYRDVWKLGETALNLNTTFLETFTGSVCLES